MKQSKYLMVFLAMLAAFGSFSTDIYLSSMPILQHNFNTTVSQVQLTLSLYFLAFGLMQLVWGPISDRVGRKPVLLIGVLIFILSSLACALSESIAAFITARIFQAIGACSGVVISSAIIRDKTSDSNEIAHMMILLTRVFLIAPMIAPVIGSHLLMWFSWHANFIFLTFYGATILGMLFLFVETHPREKRLALPYRHIFKAYCEQLAYKPFIFSTLSAGFTFCLIFAFISGSAHIYMRIYHLSAQYFGYLFLLNATGFLVANFLLGRLQKLLTMEKIMNIGMGIIFLGSFLMLILINISGLDYWAVTVPNYLVTFGAGLLSPMLSAKALSHVLVFKGLASSCNGLIRSGTSAVTGYLLSLFLTSTATPFAIDLILTSFVVLLFLCLYYKSVHQLH